MLQFDRKLHGLRIREIHFPAGPLGNERGCDIAQVVQSAVPLGQRATPFHSSHVDLNRTEEVLFAGLSKNCRYEVRRAMDKDELTCEIVVAPTETELSAFCDQFAEFALAVGIAPANAPKLAALNAVKALTLSTVRHADGGVLAQHTHLHDDSRARLLYSLSVARATDDPTRRALVGRANRLLHWTDILAFKKRGLVLYDLGGISHNAALAGIDRFKQEFGGLPVLEWNSLLGLSWVGRMALVAQNALARVRTRAGTQTPAREPAKPA